MSSFSMQKLRSFLPGQHGSGNSTNATAAHRNSVCLEPEIGFQIELTSSTQQHTSGGDGTVIHKTYVPELDVNLIAARHLPALFGFKIVQGYIVKVKMFPGSKRLDSTIQTNSWPKFHEHFKFPLTPEIKPSLKHSSRRGSKTISEFTPEELFAGQFVVFTVYALLELPPASFNRLNKTYRSLRDKSTNFMQKVVEGSTSKIKDDKESVGNGSTNGNANGSTEVRRVKRKPSDAHSKDAIPPLTISESRRNIGSATCYLEPKIFKRNPRTGLYTTEEIWLPIKDITTTIPKNINNNNLANSPKGVVEIVLEIRDLNMKMEAETANQTKINNNNHNGRSIATTPTTPTTPITPITPTTPTTPTIPTAGTTSTSLTNFNSITSTTTTTTAPTITNGLKNPQWNRMTSEMKRKMGISNNSKSMESNELVLRITTARMRCSNKVKDELEATAGSVYVKTTVFEHGIFIDSWKSTNFYPSLSTKWDNGNITNAPILYIPLQHLDDLNNLLIRTTVATKTKFGKKLVLGTVIIRDIANSSGAEHMKLLRETPANEPIAMWHSYQ